METSYRLLDFKAEWCGPCKKQDPIVEELIEENDHVELQEVDVDENQQIANDFEVRSIPTLVLYKLDDEGELEEQVSRWVGFTQKEEIAAEL